MAAQPDGARDERTGCLKAWLVLLLIMLGLGSFFYFYTGVAMGTQGNAEASRMSVLLSIAFSAGAAGAATLLARRRLGLFLLLGAFVFAGLLQLLAAFRLEILLAGLFNVGLIWWLVQPTWAKLE